MKRMAEKVVKAGFRPSSGTLAALGLLDIRSDAMPTTAYIMLGEKCTRDCAFCAQARNSKAGSGRLSRVTWPEVDERLLLEALGMATRDGKLHRVCLQTVGGSSALDSACEALATLKSACSPGTFFSVSFSATAVIDDIGKLIQAGTDKVALALDACNPELHKKIKKADMGASLALLAKASLLYPGQISTHLIAGMGETEQELLVLACSLQNMGIGLGLFAFTPLRGTEMESFPRPELESYRRVQLAFWLIKYHGIMRDDLEFDASGKLIGIRRDADEIEKLAGDGAPFETSGCAWCNRPFYNERPGTELYNYPVRLAPDVARKSLALALKGVRLSGKED
jgi:biotin synthase-related radical SAM superfamily protein